MARKPAVFGPATLCVFLAAAQLLLPVTLHVGAYAADARSPTEPTEASARLVRLLVFDHLTTLNDACQSKNFSVLRAKASPSFQRKFTEPALNAMFPHCGPRALDLRRFLLQEISFAKFDIDTAKGVLGAKGHIDDSDLRLGFEMQFEDVSGEWRLSVIALEMTRLTDKGQPAS